MKRALLVGLVAVYVAGVAADRLAQPDATTAPVIVVETTGGTFEIQTFPDEAPKTVAHIVGLVTRGFYDGLRVHRAFAGFIVQFGDPQTRDDGKRDLWGRGPAASSGTPIGAVEFSKKHLHVRGAVGIAHQGNPAEGDSQIYITLDDRPDLNGKYVVFGQVTAGEDVPAQLQVGDVITRTTVRP